MLFLFYDFNIYLRFPETPSGPAKMVGYLWDGFCAGQCVLCSSQTLRRESIHHLEELSRGSAAARAACGALAQLREMQRLSSSVPLSQLHSAAASESFGTSGWLWCSYAKPRECGWLAAAGPCVRDPAWAEPGPGCCQQLLPEVLQPCC